MTLMVIGSHCGPLYLSWQTVVLSCLSVAARRAAASAANARRLKLSVPPCVTVKVNVTMNCWADALYLSPPFHSHGQFTQPTHSLLIEAH
jgi:hypothetical protein